MPAALTPRTSRPAQVVDLGSLNLDEIATALADQTDYVPMVDQPAGRRDRLLDLYLVPGHGRLRRTDQRRARRRRLARAIDGRGAFRRFKAEPISVWYDDFRLHATIPSTEG